MTQGTADIATAKRFSLVSLAVVAFFPLGGCSSSDSQAGPIVVDSSGVMIVRSVQPRWQSSEALRLSETPHLELVSNDSDTETVLYQVTGVAVLRDGRVAVANRGDATIRLYDSSGEIVWSAGRQGDGPGEFRDLRGVLIRNGELWAYQSLPHPIHVFSMTGEYQRSVPTPSWSGPWLMGVLADGAVVATGRPTGSSESPVFSQVSPLVIFRDGGLDTLAVLPANQTVNTSLGPEWQALGPTLAVAASEDHVYAGFGATWDIGVWDQSGELVRRVQRDWVPVQITSSQRQAYGRSLTEQGEGDPRLEEAYRQLAEEMIYPSSFPAFDRIVPDGSGRLWVQRPQVEPPWSEAIDYNPVRPHPSHWDLFDPDGAWLGTLTVPARFRVMDVGVDYVAGVAKDDLDVEKIQVWGLRLPD